MSVEIQNLNESERQIIVEMPKDETQKYFEEILKDEAKKLTIPGFRKGKAPLSLVKKMYGDALFYDKLDKIAQNKFWDEIDTQGIRVIGIPKLTDIDLNDEGGLKFQIQFEVLPQIEIDNFEEIEVEKEEYELSDKYIEDVLEYLRFEKRTEEPAEKIESMEYIVVLETSSSSASTSKEPEKIPIYLKNQKINQEFVNLLLDKKLNDEFETSIPIAIESQNSEEGKDSINKTTNYKITEIKKVILPELNDDFAKDYSKGKIESLEDLKKTISQEELAYYNKDANLNLMSSIKDAFVEKFKFTPPPSLVEKQLDHKAKQLAKEYKNFEMNEETKKLLQTISEKDVRWFLIMDAIKSKYNLHLTNEEIDNFAQSLAEKYNQDKNAILQYLQTKGSVLLEEKESEKFFDFILSKIKVKTKKVII